ncbi:MAG: hypothetical protein IJY24_00335 [Clostridia bacterium]|nr:hypothetical protein [Clostridia bacterium]
MNSIYSSGCKTFDEGIMGFFGDLIKSVVVEVARDASITAVTELIHRSRSSERVLGNGSNNLKLLVKKKIFAFDNSFYVLSETGKKVYQVKIGLFKSSLRLFDMDGKLRGEIKKSKHKNGVRFDLYASNKKLGSIYSESSIKYDIDFNGWYIKGSVLSWRYDVYNVSDALVMQIYKCTGNNESYVIEYNNSSDELLGLLLVFTLEMRAK